MQHNTYPDTQIDIYNNIEKYTEYQIQTALCAANIETAIALWQDKDWHTYRTTRAVLMALIRSGRGEEVALPQMQFIYFINTHLRSRVRGNPSDCRAFLEDLSPDCMNEPSWIVATRGDFWDEVL